MIQGIPGRRLLTVVALAVGASALTLPLSADWLVTVTGQRIETSGPWQVKGKQVLFTAKNGTLSSLRLTEVDLEASRQASEPPPPAEEAPAPEPPPKKKPVLVLTDKDIARARSAEKTDEEAAAGESKEGTAKAPAGGATANANAVELVTWKEIDKDPTLGVELMGTVCNTSADLVTGVTVMVKLLDGGGALIAEKQASLAPSSLAAGASANFRVLFSDVRGFATPKFEIRSALGVRVVGTPPPAETP